jgi:hypothetical protein
MKKDWKTQVVDSQPIKGEALSSNPSNNNNNKNPGSAECGVKW